MTNHQRLRQSPPAWSPGYQAKAYHEKKKKTELKEKENQIHDIFHDMLVHDMFHDMFVH